MGIQKTSGSEGYRFYTPPAEQNGYSIVKPKGGSLVKPKGQPIAGPHTAGRRQETLEVKDSGNVSSSLEGEVQAKMEDSFGQDFSGVRIHKDSGSAKDMNAKAYTQGTDIHFAPGAYHPDSKEGLALIGHELTHVVQQRQGRVGQEELHGKGLEINQDAGLEKEADEAGKLASEGKRIEVNGNARGIQKKEAGTLAIEKGEYLIHSKYLSLELGKRIYDKINPIKSQEIKDTLTRWRNEKGFETKENEKHARDNYAYEPGSSIVQCINPDGALTINGYFQDEKGRIYSGMIYTEAASTTPVIDFREKERERPGYTFSKDKDAWYNMEGRTESNVSFRHGMLILGGTALVALSGGGALLVEGEIALWFAMEGLFTSIDDLVGIAMKDQKNNPWYDQDSGIEQLLVKMELDIVTVIYKGGKITVGLINFRQFVKNLSSEADTPTKIFDALNAFIDGLNTGKDIVVPITNRHDTNSNK
jgi:hypothetical protein